MQQYFENRQCIKFEDIQNQKKKYENIIIANERICLLYTSPSPRD